MCRPVSFGYKQLGSKMGSSYPLFASAACPPGRVSLKAVYVFHGLDREPDSDFAGAVEKLE